MTVSSVSQSISTLSGTRQPVRFGKNTLYVLDFDNCSAHTLPGGEVRNDDALLQQFDDTDVVITNTGRPFADMEAKATPAWRNRLDNLVTRDGTLIWEKRNGQWVPDELFLKSLPKRYNPEKVLTTVGDVCRQFREQRQLAVDEYHEPGSPTILLHTQDEDVKNKFIETLKRQLAKAGQKDFQILQEDQVTRGTADHASGFYVIKVPPQGTSKGIATLALAERYLKSHPHLQKMLIAGDSETDLANFLVQPPAGLKVLKVLVNRHADSVYRKILEAASPGRKLWWKIFPVRVKTGFQPKYDLYVSHTDPKQAPPPAGLREGIEFFKTL
jgi:hydroxymethylpyrimidine pyrophosphatase-like HAD family hydrolase